MSKHRHVTCHFHTTRNAWCHRDVRIYNSYGLKACSNILSNNFCLIHLTISKIGCHRLNQQCWHACTMKFWKFENCMFCEITSSNVHGFSSNLQNRCSFIQMILMRGKSTMLTPKLHMYEIWSELKKHNILLNFWVNIGMWPVVFARLVMPNATVMSEYMIYMVWKLIEMFCPITSVAFIWQFQKLAVTG